MQASMEQFVLAHDEMSTEVIADGEHVSWGDFIRAHMALLEPPPEVSEISRAEIEASRGRSSGLLLGSMKAA